MMRVGVLFTLFTVSNVLLQAEDKPLSQCDVMVYMLLSNSGRQHMMNAFQKPGITFQVSEPFVNDLRNAGATEDLITGLRNAAHAQDGAQFPCEPRVYEDIAAAAQAQIRAFSPTKDAAADWRTSTSDKDQQLRQAGEKLREAIALQPMNPLLHLGRSSVLEDWEAKLEEDRKTVDLDPTFGMAHAQLASDLMMRAHQLEDRPVHREQVLINARDEFYQAVNLEPQNCWLHTDYATFLVDQKQYRLADEQLDAAEKQCPKNTYVMYLRANSMANQGKPFQAIAQLKSALAVQPCNFIVSGYLATLLENKGDFAAAKQAMRDHQSNCASR